MKNIFIALFCFLFVNSAFTIDYYYYQGAKIELSKREDKIVVVLNRLGQSNSAVINELKNTIATDDDVRVVMDNIFTINFKDGSNLAKIDNLISGLTQRSDLIKFAAPVYYGTSRSVTAICADEFIVRLRSNIDKSKLDLLNVQYGVEILGNVADEKGFHLKTLNNNPARSLDLCNDYLSSGIFEYCEPNFYYPDGCLLTLDPNDTQFGLQWALKNTGQSITSESNTNGDAASYNGVAGSDMKANLAWDFTTGSSSVEVGVFDTGIDSTHPDLVANVLRGYDAVRNLYGVPRDSASHGTCCAGIIGASINNSLGVAGIAGNCKLRSYRIFNSSGSTSDIICARAFDSARVNGIQISSNSWGGGTANATLTNAINNCALNGRNGIGVVILFSSGNNGANINSYPSTLPNVICVGASTASDQKKAPGTGNQFWWGGNYGPELECVAPTITPSTDRQGTPGYNTSAGVAGDYYMTFNGTSCSCPNAAGVAALILSVNTALTPAQITDYLLRGCDKVDNMNYSTNGTYGKWNEYMGYGRVNAYNSVRLAAGVDVTPPSINHTPVESHSSTYPTFFTAEILDQNGSAIDTSVYKPMVLYRTNKISAGWSSFDSLTFDSKASNTYTFKIPGFGWETQIQYYIKAKDAAGNTALFPYHAPDTTNLCYYAIASMESVSQKIPSFALTSQGVSTSANVSFTSFKILKTKVKINLRHTYLEDMNFTLVSPNTNTAFNRKCLFSRSAPAGSTTGITSTVVTDSASLFWRSGTQPYSSGLFKPDYILNGLNGLNASGNWSIKYYDAISGDGGTSDSVVITLYRASGTTSPSAGINSSGDSVVTFDGTNTDTTDYYLKNDGTSSLTISGTSFTGTYASKFSLLSSPGSIAANDSGLFRIRCNPLAPRPKGGNEPLLDDSENAQLNISTNDPSKPTVIVSLQTPAPLPVELISFTSSVERNTVKLNWTTSFELNNSGFDVERKLSGTNEWKKLAAISGAGNTNTQVNYSYSDNNVSTGKYNYRLKQIDFNGNYEYHSLANEVNVGIPSQFNLSQNYPNPFNPSTKINYDLPFDSRVSIRIYDITGREITSLVNQVLAAGYHTVNFNASNLASGIYFYSINAEGGNKNFVKSMKMVLVK